MWEELPVRQLHFRTHLSNCSCKCRFCCLGECSYKDIAFKDYARVIKRFVPYCKSHNIRLRSYVYNSLEYKELEEHLKLCQQIGMPDGQCSYFDINGTRVRSGEELASFIKNLKHLGMKSAGITWFGLRSYHDAFVNRIGYFDYLERAAVALRESGIRVKGKLFLTPAMLSDSLELLEYVETLSDVVQFGMVEYTGFAKDDEALFLKEEDFKSLPDRVKFLFGESFSETFRSEKEWVGLVAEGKAPRFTHRDLIIYVDGDNIDGLLNGCVEEEICRLNDLDKRLRGACGSLEEIARTFGDRESRVLLEWRDVVRKWLASCYRYKGYSEDDLFSLTKSSVEWKINEMLYTNGSHRVQQV